jgi:hypothetical protein
VDLAEVERDWAGGFDFDALLRTILFKSDDVSAGEKKLEKKSFPQLSAMPTHSSNRCKIDYCAGCKEDSVSEDIIKGWDDDGFEDLSERNVIGVFISFPQFF